jgi:DNA repair exonuclease SbcCD nuclease subunit
MRKFNLDVSRGFLISDLHFGVKASNLEWQQIMKDYFHNFFFPLLRKESKKGDIIFILGDVYDNRTSIKVDVLDGVVEILEEMSKILPIVMIPGNHDLYKKDDNGEEKRINSLKTLKWIPNVYLYERPVIMECSNKKVLLVPWVGNHEIEQNILTKFNADYAFMHTEFQGVQFNRYTKVEHGVESESAEKYAKIYSGHIHYRQSLKNITFIGSPYQMTRGDIGNDKGIYLLNFETGEETFFENTYSPKFLTCNFEELVELNLQQINEFVRGNFLDIRIPAKYSETNQFQLRELISSARSITFFEEDEVAINNEKYNLQSLESFNILQLLNENANHLIEQKNYSSTKKDFLQSKIKLYYEKSQETV